MPTVARRILLLIAVTALPAALVAIVLAPETGDGGSGLMRFAVRVPLSATSEPSVSRQATPLDPARAPAGGVSSGAAVLAASVGAVEGSVELRGRVIDLLSGAPVPDATVELVTVGEPPALGPAAVDADGRFSLAIPASTRLDRSHLLARAPGRPCRRSDRLGASTREVVLRLGRHALSVEGVLVTREGVPIQGVVEARVQPDDRLLVLTATSGPDGRFRFDGIPPGEGGLGPRCAQVELRATADDGRLAGGLPEVAVAPGGEPVRVVLRRRHELVVRVRDADGRPISTWGQAKLVDGPAWAGQSLANRQRAEIVWTALEDACVEVTLEAVGHLPRRFVVRLPVEPIEVRLQRGAGALLGDVVGPDGAPIAGAGLRVEWSRPSAPAVPVARGEVRDLEPTAGRQFGAADPLGRFRVAGLPAGATFRVSASSPYFERGTLDGVRVGEHVRVALKPRGAEGAVVRFRAVAAESGSALEGRLRVRARKPSGEELFAIISNSNEGQDLSLGAHSGPLALCLEAPGRVSRELDVHVTPGKPALLGDVSLLAAGAVKLTFEGWPALPVAAVRARWRDPDGRERAAAQPEPGATWTIEDIAPGSTELDVEVVVVDGDPIRRAVAAHVRADVTTDVTVHLGGAD